MFNVFNIEKQIKQTETSGILQKVSLCFCIHIHIYIYESVCVHVRVSRVYCMYLQNDLLLFSFQICGHKRDYAQF